MITSGKANSERESQLRSSSLLKGCILATNAQTSTSLKDSKKQKNNQRRWLPLRSKELDLESCMFSELQLESWSEETNSRRIDGGAWRRWARCTACHRHPVCDDRWCFVSLPWADLIDVGQGAGRRHGDTKEKTQVTGYRLQVAGCRRSNSSENNEQTIAAKLTRCGERRSR